MWRRIQLRTVLFLAVSILLSSCISTKKHQEAIGEMKSGFDAELTQMTYKLETSNYKNDSLGLVIAQKEGENKALLTVQDKLQDRIDDLQGQIENVTDLALSQRQSLQETIQDKEKDLEEKELKINELNIFLTDTENAINDLMNTCRDSLSQLDSLGQATFAVVGNELHLNISSSVFFQKGRHKINTRSSSNAIKTLETISKILNKNPDKYITIVGHTDNSTANTRSYRDNWDLSVLQSASIAQMLVEEFELNPNQLTVAGKGEFVPTTSNETSEGKDKNRRIQFVISKGNNVLVREVKKRLQSLRLN